MLSHPIVESDICVIQGMAKINNNIKVKYFYFKLLPFFRELKRFSFTLISQQVGGVIFDVGSHAKPKRLQRTKSFGLR